MFSKHLFSVGFFGVRATIGAAIVEAVEALTVATREASAARDVRALHDLVADARDAIARK